jgi:uncharacterized phage protein (TIGR02218 family)
VSVRFAGYAAIFGVPDRGGDVVRAGAFAGACPVPLLWQHRGAPVGQIEMLAEDSRGLRVIGRVELPELADLVREGALGGLSFGYRVQAARHGRWRELTRLVLGEGSLGAVETGDGGFTAELRGVAAALERPVVEETSPTCRARLGDGRCRVAMAGRRRFARVVAVEERLVTLDRAEPVADAYGAGRLRWFGGANAGLEAAIAVSEGATVTLERMPALPVGRGDLVELVEGCDKRLETCAARFGNAVDFRGEPYLPGVDLLTRYPGA